MITLATMADEVELAFLAARHNLTKILAAVNAGKWPATDYERRISHARTLKRAAAALKLFSANHHRLPADVLEQINREA